MKITNRQNLPESIARAIRSDPYSKGGSDFSVTEIIDPPQLRALLVKHHDQIEEDVVDRLWALYGQSVHAVLERAARPGDIVEQRFYMPTQYGVLSGQVDLYTPDSETLTDFKVTSVYKVKKALKEVPPEWEAQLNCQAELMRHAGIDPVHLQIVAICRDWSKGGKARDKDYPSRAVAIPIQRWEDTKAHEYIENRCHLHWQARRGTLTPCTDAERWMESPKYAVMRKGRKRADRLLDSLEDTRAYLIDNGLAEPDENGKMKMVDGVTIEHRIGRYIRCEEYCAVADYCTQYERSE